MHAITVIGFEESCFGPISSESAEQWKNCFIWVEARLESCALFIYSSINQNSSEYVSRIARRFKINTFSAADVYSCYQTVFYLSKYYSRNFGIERDRKISQHFYAVSPIQSNSIFRKCFVNVNNFWTWHWMMHCDPDELFILATTKYEKKNGRWKQQPKKSHWWSEKIWYKSVARWKWSGENISHLLLYFIHDFITRACIYV